MFGCEAGGLNARLLAADLKTLSKKIQIPSSVYSKQTLLPKTQKSVFVWLNFSQLNFWFGFLIQHRNKKIMI